MINTTDWNLVRKGLLSIDWIIESAKKENVMKTCSELYREKFIEDYPDINIINEGTLMMAAYLFFVYPQQADYDNINFEYIDYKEFIILESCRSHSSKDFFKRLRNSISHARFKIDHENYKITFEDFINGKDYIKFQIGSMDFYTVIQRFLSIASNSPLL